MARSGLHACPPGEGGPTGLQEALYIRQGPTPGPSIREASAARPPGWRDNLSGRPSRVVTGWQEAGPRDNLTRRGCRTRDRMSGAVLSVHGSAMSCSSMPPAPSRSWGLWDPVPLLGDGDLRGAGFLPGTRCRSRRESRSSWTWPVLGVHPGAPRSPVPLDSAHCQ